MPRSRSTIALPLAASMGLALGAARAEDSNGQVSAAAPPPASASASSPSTTSTPPLRRPRPEPTVVEVIDLGGDRDPQGFAMGAHVGGAFLWNRDSIGQGAGTIALVADFGLGPNSARVPWTLEPFISFAVPYGVLFEQGGHPNRFTEIGARLVYRFPGGALEGRWVSLGGGLVWTSRNPASGFAHPSGACSRNRTRAAELGLDCSHDGSISPGALVDIGFGLYESVARRGRWGIGARVPIQISSAPGFAAIGFFYVQIGTAL